MPQGSDPYLNLVELYGYQNPRIGPPPLVQFEQGAMSQNPFDSAGFGDPYMPLPEPTHNFAGRPGGYSGAMPIIGPLPRDMPQDTPQAGMKITKKVIKKLIPKERWQPTPNDPGYQPDPFAGLRQGAAAEAAQEAAPPSPELPRVRSRDELLDLYESGRIKAGEMFRFGTEDMQLTPQVISQLYGRFS
jgi:hypothetical protein